MSSGSAGKHASFASYHNLPFTLLSDEGSAVRKSFGGPAIRGLAPGRVTYVIDRTGTIRHSFNSMTDISQHVSAAGPPA